MTWRFVTWLRAPRRRLDRPAGAANPFEAYLLIVSIVQGVAVLSGYARPPAIEAVLPLPLRLAWGFLLLVGGAASVVGLYWPWDPIDGILIKRIGLVALASGAFAYGVALLASGPAGFVAAAGILAFGVACAARAWQVTVALAAFRGDLAALRRRGARLHRRDATDDQAGT